MRAVASKLLAVRPTYLRTSTDIEDAMQDGWLGQLEGRRADWAIRDAMPHWRPGKHGSNKRVVKLPALREPSQMLRDAESPSHEARVLAAFALHEWLEELPERTREWAVLRWCLGWDLADIARAYGVTQSRVCQVLRAVTVG